MLLDDGIATIRRKVNVAPPGDKPFYEFDDYFVSYYGEKTVGINRYWAAKSHDDQADFLIEIQRNGGIRTADICHIEPFKDIPAGGMYKIIQVQHVLDENQLPMTDITLERIDGVESELLENRTGGNF